MTNLKKKEVSKEDYARLLDQHKHEVYHIAFKGYQMPILHGLIALAADHPGVKKLGWPTEQLIAQVRWWCREKFSEWGFPPEEVEYLDKVRQDAQGNITEEKELEALIHFWKDSLAQHRLLMSPSAVYLVEQTIKSLETLANLATDGLFVARLNNGDWMAGTGGEDDRARVSP